MQMTQDATSLYDGRTWLLGGGGRGDSMASWEWMPSGVVRIVTLSNAVISQFQQQGKKIAR
jgi:hypothetical protein